MRYCPANRQQYRLDLNLNHGGAPNPVHKDGPGNYCQPRNAGVASSSPLRIGADDMTTDYPQMITFGEMRASAMC